ncbi:MAG: helix-turn-helix domain-containing protein [Candidatus Omnitrophica bacterium]|nr:helix-turn-helix domain-containing protein [Candidatus Omnitrophota bacterium]
MGVTYKLTDDVVQFIIDQKQNDDSLSCRQISSLIKDKFQLSVSKSSVNNVLKNQQLSNQIGRPLKKNTQDDNKAKKRDGKRKSQTQQAARGKKDPPSINNKQIINNVLPGGSVSKPDVFKVFIDVFNIQSFIRDILPDLQGQSDEIITVNKIVTALYLYRKSRASREDIPLLKKLDCFDRKLIDNPDKLYEFINRLSLMQVTKTRFAKFVNQFILLSQWTRNVRLKTKNQKEVVLKADLRKMLNNQRSSELYPAVYTIDAVMKIFVQDVQYLCLKIEEGLINNENFIELMEICQKKTRLEAISVYNKNNEVLASYRTIPDKVHHYVLFAEKTIIQEKVVQPITKWAVKKPLSLPFLKEQLHLSDQKFDIKLLKNSRFFEKDRLIVLWDNSKINIIGAFITNDFISPAENIVKKVLEVHLDWVEENVIERDYNKIICNNLKKDEIIWFIENRHKLMESQIYENKTFMVDSVLRELICLFDKLYDDYRNQTSNLSDSFTSKASHLDL